MSKWTHSICDACWTKRNPERAAVRLKEPTVEKCCWCGEVHESGIYVRDFPEEVPCEGVHKHER
jgi:hypothetical protein